MKNKMTFKEFTNKLDRFEDNHPVLADLIKVVCGLGFVVELIIICIGFGC